MGSWENILGEAGEGNSWRLSVWKPALKQYGMKMWHQIVERNSVWLIVTLAVAKAQINPGPSAGQQGKKGQKSKNDHLTTTI